MERGPVKEIEKNPSHPYTRGLYKSILQRELRPKEKLYTIEGSPPNIKIFQRAAPFIPDANML